MRSLFLSLAILLIAAAGAPLAAQVPGPFDLRGKAAAVSDYRFRGVSMSGEDPALQASVEVDHISGFYGGLWGSTLERGESFDRLAGTAPADYGPVELDLYGGWQGSIASGIDLDLGLVYYAFPDADDPPGAGAESNRDFIEGRAALSYRIGPAGLTAGAAYAPDQEALTGDNLYLYADAAIGVPTTPVTLIAHLGYSDGALAAGPDGDHLDWQLGVEYVRGPLVFGLSYVDTDAPAGPRTDAGLVGSIALSF